MTAEHLLDGKYQDYLTEKWSSDFIGNRFLRKIRNQFLFSLFHVSPNTNVCIGADGYLFEPMYILFELQYYPPSSDSYFSALEEKLAQLDGLLRENGKELYVFITPSKARYYRDFIPLNLRPLDMTSEYDYTNHSRLIETLEEADIRFFDSVDFIDRNLKEERFVSPVFYKSGIHWNHVWGVSAAAEFVSYMNKNSAFSFPAVTVSERLTDTPVAPDADLYESLNLLTHPNETWYDAEIAVEESDAQRPNVFLRGGSFMGQSLDALVQSGLFGKDVHLENNYYFTDRYSNQVNISSYTSYDEMDLNTLLAQSDILILEVNEAAIYTMSFGFIDYLLEHPDYLDGVA